MARRKLSSHELTGRTSLGSHELESDPRRGDRDEPGRVGDRPATRPGATPRARPWAAPRDPDPAQGQHRDRRRHGDDGRLARPRRQPRPARRHGRRAPAGGRRGHPRQGEPVGVGQLPRLRPGGLPGRPVPQRLERAGRLHPRPVRPRLGPVRLELGLGCRAGRQPVRRGGRHRDRRVGRMPGRQQRDRRAQADPRAGVAAGDHPDRPQPGHRRADGPDRDRRGDHAQRDEVAVRAGEGASPAPRLHPLPAPGRARRRPDRRRPTTVRRGVLRRSGSQRRDRAGAGGHGLARRDDRRPGRLRPTRSPSATRSSPSCSTSSRSTSRSTCDRSTTRRCGRSPTSSPSTRSTAPRR